MKISRLIEILLTLLSRETVTATEFAKRFEVSKKTIYRDVDSLNVAGIPIYLKRGRYGGLTLEKGYKLDKNLLSKQDLDNILSTLSTITHIVADESLMATFTKMQHMSDTNSALFLDFRTLKDNNDLQILVKETYQAIQAHQIIKFQYIDAKGTPSYRHVEPANILWKFNNWYLHAFDQTKQDFRFFKLSRMQNVRILKMYFTPRERTSLPPTFFYPEEKRYPLTLIFDHAIRDRIVELWGSSMIQKHDDTRNKIAIFLPTKVIAYQKILSFGKHVELTGSPIFIEKFKHYLAELTTHFGMD